MAKGKPYQSRLSEMRASDGKAHRLGSSYGGPPRNKSDYSKNSAKAYNPMQTGEYGSGNSKLPADAGKLYGCKKHEGSQFRSGPERKSETGAQYAKRMARHFE